VTQNPKTPVILVGLLRVREHCTFTWQGPERGQRSVEIVSTHCSECIAEIRRLGYQLIYKEGAKPEGEKP